MRHIHNAKRYGVPVVIAVNSFKDDTEAEIELVRKYAVEAGAEGAHKCTHWMHGGKGAIELAEAVMKAAHKPKQFEFLYPLDLTIKEKIEAIAKFYGADYKLPTVFPISSQAPARARSRSERGAGRQSRAGR